MKFFNSILILTSVSCFMLTACQSAGSEQADTAQLMDTVITEVRDTIVTFYPETYEEVVQEVISYDTVITPRTPVLK